MGVGQETRWLKAAAPWSKIPRPIAPCRSPRRLPNNVARKACAEAADAPCVVRGPLAGLVRRAALCRALPALEPRRARSEEHTSELQSLMRISYAVFCLKKKTSR